MQFDTKHRPHQTSKLQEVWPRLTTGRIWERGEACLQLPPTVVSPGVQRAPVSACPRTARFIEGNTDVLGVFKFTQRFGSYKEGQSSGFPVPRPVMYSPVSLLSLSHTVTLQMAATAEASVGTFLCYAFTSKMPEAPPLPPLIGTLLLPGTALPAHLPGVLL